MEPQPSTSRRAKTSRVFRSPSPKNDPQIPTPQIPPPSDFPPSHISPTETPKIPLPRTSPSGSSHTKRSSEQKQILVTLYDLVQYQSSGDVLFNKVLKDIIRKMKTMAFRGTTDKFETVDKIPPLHCYTLFHQLLDEKRIIHKQKPIPWCTNCKVSQYPHTAVFLKTVTKACYVTFPFDINSARNIFRIPEYPLSSPNRGVSFLIWTTSPWSLPLNQALALHPGVRYSLVDYPCGIFVVASSRVSHVDQEISGKSEKSEKSGISYNVLGDATGKEICSWVTRVSHVFEEKGGVPVVLSDGVSENMGTGVVHIVPGCSETDFCVGLKYGLPVHCPIDEQGRFTSKILPSNLAGLSLPLASESVLKTLETAGRLVTTSEVEHHPPHCPTCQLPLIILTKSHWFWNMGGGAGVGVGAGACAGAGASNCTGAGACACAGAGACTSACADARAGADACTSACADARAGAGACTSACACTGVGGEEEATIPTDTTVTAMNTASTAMLIPKKYQKWLLSTLKATAQDYVCGTSTCTDGIPYGTSGVTSTCTDGVPYGTSGVTSTCTEGVPYCTSGVTSTCKDGVPYGTSSITSTFTEDGVPYGTPGVTSTCTDGVPYGTSGVTSTFTNGVPYGTTSVTSTRTDDVTSGNSKCPCCGTCDSLVWDSSVFSPHFEQLAMASASAVVSTPHIRLYVENQLGHAMSTCSLLLGNAFRDTVRKDVVAVQKDVVAVQKDVTVRKNVAVRKDVAAVQKDVAAVQKDVAAVQKDVVAVQKDVVAVQKDVAVVRENVAVRKDVTAVQKDVVAVVQKDVAAVQKDVTVRKNDTVRKDLVTVRKDTVSGETSIIFVHAYCRLSPEVSPEELVSLPGDVFRIWVMCSKYSAEEVLVTKESLKEAQREYTLFGHFFRELRKFRNPHICQKPQSPIHSQSGGIESYLLTILHKTNTKIQKSYSLLDLNESYILARTFVVDFNSLYWPMIIDGETCTCHVSRNVVLSIFEVFSKLLAPFLPDLAEEAYHSIISLRCDSSTNQLHLQSFMETEDKMNKEIKQRWEALERLRELVEKEKNRFLKEKGFFKGRVVVSLVLNITSCRDGNSVYLLLEGEGFVSLLGKFFGVDGCHVKFVEDTEKKFSKNLKQGCIVDVTLEEP